MKHLIAIASFLLLGLSSCSVMVHDQEAFLHEGELVLTVADSLAFGPFNNEVGIDSVYYKEGSKYFYVDADNWVLHATHLPYGKSWLTLQFYLQNGKKRSYQHAVRVVSDIEPEVIQITDAEIIPHDPNYYTQGLSFYNGFLYESTGLKGSSLVAKIDPGTGEVLKTKRMHRELFGEGHVVINDTIWCLTWKNHRLLKIDCELEYLREYVYPLEGWGLESIDNKLIATNGSQFLFTLNRQLELVDTLEVVDHHGVVLYLNELETIHGDVWANVYGRNYIVVIDVESGKVKQLLDFSSLIEKYNLASKGILNGIAYDDQASDIYVTGKNWPLIFKFNLKSVIR